MGFFDNTSTSKQTNISVGGQGQYNAKSKIAQGAAKAAQGKGSQFAEQGGAVIGPKGSLQTGTIITGGKGSVFTITNPPPAATETIGGQHGVAEIPFTPPVSAPLPATVPGSDETIFDKIKGFFEKKNDKGEVSVNYMAIAIAVGIVIAAGYLLKAFRK